MLELSDKGATDKNKAHIIIYVSFKNLGGVDGTRTRDPRRDRPVF